MKIILSVTLLFISCISIASDTTWLDNKWHGCNKNIASYYSIALKEDNLYHQRIFYSNSHEIYLDGYYLEPSLLTKTGSFKTYNTAGILTDSMTYSKGRLIHMKLFYENGKKKTETSYDYKTSSCIDHAISWDRDGNEAVADTFYHDRAMRLCHKDTAFFIEKINKEDSAWRVRINSLNGDSIQFLHYYRERSQKTPTRYYSYHKNYRLRDSVIFSDAGKPAFSWRFHNNGNPCSYTCFDASGKYLSRKNWTEEGKETEVRDYIKWAMPVTGFKTWQKKILKKINNDDSIDRKRRKDLYGSVYIGFHVNDEGVLQNIFIKEPSIYPDMDAIILNACLEKEPWTPCIVNGRREHFIGVHSFSFVKGKVIRYQTLY